MSKSVGDIGKTFNRFNMPGAGKNSLWAQLIKEQLKSRASREWRKQQLPFGGCRDTGTLEKANGIPEIFHVQMDISFESL